MNFLDCIFLQSSNFWLNVFFSKRLIYSGFRGYGFNDIRFSRLVVRYNLKIYIVFNYCNVRGKLKN